MKKHCGYRCYIAKRALGLVRGEDQAAPTRRRGSGIVRTLIVGSATMAILLVCFSIYQSRQAPPPSQPPLSEPRLPPTPTQAPSQPPAREPGDAGDAGAGLPLGRGGVISHGRDVRISIYPREGTRARMEIAVESWRPTGQAPNEFLLVNPEVRLRANDGRAIKVTAREGVMEAERRGTGSLDPRRGELTGDVVIEIDRLTEADRAKLPADRRDLLDPAQIVRIDVSQIQFDLEYSKVVVPPGSFKLTARDIDFSASDLEARFDETEGKLESLRIVDGGRIIIKSDAREFGITIPGTEEQPVEQVTIADWLRATIQRRLAHPAATGGKPIPPQGSEPTTSAQLPPVSIGADGIPIFRGDDETKPARPPLRYVARFEQDVQARQMAGDVVRSYLQSDVLEIVRAFTDADRQRTSDSAAAKDSGPGAAARPGSSEAEQLSSTATPSEDRIELEWTGRLIVESCTADDPRCAPDIRSRVVARGQPVRITGPQGDARCTELTYDPDSSLVWLDGTDASPVRVQSGEQGTLTGLRVQSRQSGNDIHIQVTGPGTLERTPDGLNLVAGPPTTPRDDTAPGVRFADQLDLFARVETRTRLELSGLISRYQARVLDRAVFTGGVNLLESETRVSADALTAYFSSAGGRGDRSSIDRVEGRGHVLMAEKKDRLTCDEIDLTLATDAQGRTIPVSAEARGHVEAQQRKRNIRTRDRLIADFEMIERPPAPFDLDKARQAAVASGMDPAAVDWDAKQRVHEAQRHVEAGVKRLRAWGDVRITDPAQGVDISAEVLDCSLRDGREIAAATLEGTEASPASAALNAFAVAGRQVKVHVPDEWAEVPGAGRLTLFSKKDLDGRRVEKPIPIVITWSDWMKYQGRENRSVFMGNVHAASGNNTTFDCSQLLVEFDEVASSETPADPARDWWVFTPLVENLTGDADDDLGFVTRKRFSKEPAYLLATGKAVAEIAEWQADGDKLRSRARIAGPRLSVNLRKEVSKMLIEGVGYLQIEDFSPADPATRSEAAPRNELFTLATGDGPSKTLIEWQQSMWYDFSIHQTRFEGQVSLKHFSGQELERIFGPAGGASGAVPAASGNTANAVGPSGAGSKTARAPAQGRSTFLRCDMLTVDFAGRGDSPGAKTEGRLGRLSANDLRGFRAAGAVSLQDKTEGLSLTAADLTYERDRSLLFVQGLPTRKANIVIQRPGEYPTPVSVERFIYNLKTKSVEILRGEGIR